MRLRGELLPGDDRNVAVRYAGHVRGEQLGGGFHDRGVFGVVANGRPGVRADQLEVRACAARSAQHDLRLQRRGLQAQQG